ncbi:MAG: hypothetical protein ABIV21_07900 [Pyrinomonadaceae bacterium]
MAPSAMPPARPNENRPQKANKFATGNPAVDSGSLNCSLPTNAETNAAHKSAIGVAIGKLIVAAAIRMAIETEIKNKNIENSAVGGRFLIEAKSFIALRMGVEMQRR